MRHTTILLAITLIFAGCATHSPANIEPELDAGPAPAGTFRVVTVQLKSSQVGDFTVINQLIQKAANAGAQLVVLPESSVHGWLNPNVFTDAEPIPGTASTQFSAMARNNNVWIAAGLAEQGASINNGTHYAFDSGILIDPTGEIIIHHRKYQVLKNAFASCPQGFDNCQYSQGPLSDITVVNTPFGRTALLVCADAYTWDTTALAKLKALKPQTVIVPWGVGAATQNECGNDGFNATTYSAAAASFLGSAYVVGANAVGVRPYGRFRPAVYCGNSGYANPDGTVGGESDTMQQFGLFDIPLPSAN